LAFAKCNITYKENKKLLVIIDKFEPNPILVDINTIKPYQVLNVAPKGLTTPKRGKD
jgi:hypothetical protein